MNSTSSNSKTFVKQHRQNWCSVVNCDNRISIETTKKMSFFRFPKDSERCLKWIMFCGQEDFLKYDVSYLHEKYRICMEHFEDYMFANPLTKNRLTNTAEPTLFGNYNNFINLRQHRDDIDNESGIFLEINGEPEYDMRKSLGETESLSLTTDSSSLTVPQVNGDSDYRCYDCSKNFTSEHCLLIHLFKHIKQPAVRISAIQKAPIKLTFKTRSDNCFEIIKSPTTTEFQASSEDSTAQSPIESESNLEEITTEDLDLFAREHEDMGEGTDLGSDLGDAGDVNHLNGLDDVANVMFSPNFGVGSVGDSPARSDGSYSNTASPASQMNIDINHDNASSSDRESSNDVPGAEPTPPPESPSPTAEFPKIRIKTTGLLKEPLTITELTEDDPNGEFGHGESFSVTTLDCTMLIDNVIGSYQVDEFADEKNVLCCDELSCPLCTSFYPEEYEIPENIDVSELDADFIMDQCEEAITLPRCEEVSDIESSPSLVVTFRDDESVYDPYSDDGGSNDMDYVPSSSSESESEVENRRKNPENMEIDNSQDNCPKKDGENEIIELSNTNVNSNHQHTTNYWSTPLIEDPLKISDSENILTNFLNNTDHVSDNEFISLDRLDERNSTTLQVYNPSNSAVTTLDNITGLPMQQLAEQVSRLQPSGNSTMHQQNVLINIQQFPQAPQPPPPPPPQTTNFQQPSMFPPHPGMPGHPPPPPMYQHQPYQYQPNPIYYPPGPNFPPAPHLPPPQMQQPSQQIPPPQQQQGLPPPQQGMPPPSGPPQQPQYRQPMPPRPPGGTPPRQYGPQSPRAPAPRQPNFQPRQRAPMIRTRGGIVGPSVRGARPRMPGGSPVNNVQNHNNNVQHQRMIKRTSDQMQDFQAKKKRVDVFVPDLNDDADCQVIAVQPKNTDGGLPQIQSVQGGTSDASDNVMHLSDSITLSVRNPPPKQDSPKKSDAKVVANILATRGITVTATPKAKNSPSKDGSQAPSVAINLNNAVSIIPTAKGNSPGPTNKQNDHHLPTVDLTDDSIPEPSRNAATRQLLTSPQKAQSGALPFKCDLCPAQYPTAQGLSKHRQSYHKTASSCEIGIPLIDFKQPGIVQKLTSLGIYNFIPLPNSTPNGNFALPVVSVNAARNSSVCNLAALGASSILTLGPVRSLPKPQAPTNNVSAPKQH